MPAPSEEVLLQQLAQLNERSRTYGRQLWQVPLAFVVGAAVVIGAPRLGGRTLDRHAYGSVIPIIVAAAFNASSSAKASGARAQHLSSVSNGGASERRRAADLVRTVHAGLNRMVQSKSRRRGPPVSRREPTRRPAGFQVVLEG